MKLIYRAGDTTEAHIISGMLNANGVESFVGGHYLQGGIGDMAVQDFAMVHVADEDADEARRLIAAYEGTAKSEDSVDSAPVSNKSDVGILRGQVLFCALLEPMRETRPYTPLAPASLPP